MSNESIFMYVYIHILLITFFVYRCTWKSSISSKVSQHSNNNCVCADRDWNTDWFRMWMDMSRYRRRDCGRCLCSSFLVDVMPDFDITSNCLTHALLTIFFLFLRVYFHKYMIFHSVLHSWRRNEPHQSRHESLSDRRLQSFIIKTTTVMIHVVT